MSFRASLFVAVGLAVPACASADPVTILSLGRYANTGAGLGTTSTTDTQQNSNTLVSSSTMSGAPGTATGAATLLSGMGFTDIGLTFSGTGSATASLQTTAFLAGASGRTSYLLTFELSAPQQFNFQAGFTSSGLTNDVNYAFWEALLFVAPATMNGKTFFDFTGYDSRTVAASGVLAPGRYGFGVDTVANATAGTFTSDVRQAFAFALSDVAPTPEPGSMALLGTGLVGLAGMVRRRARA